MNRLFCGNVLEVLPTLERHTCLIADPFDNIGLNYSEYNDKMTPDEYRAFMAECLDLFVQKASVVWISYNARWTFMMGSLVEDILDQYPDYEAKPFTQTFSFGQNNKRDCGNGHRPIVRLKTREAPLYPDAIKVPSWRQLNGDKRAAPGGRVPLDAWDDFPRITGNCKERRPHHPTQIREGMVKRMVDLSTQPGDTVLDCFSGTGTVLRAVKDRHITSIELDRGYCDKIAEEHGLSVMKAWPAS